MWSIREANKNAIYNGSEHLRSCSRARADQYIPTRAQVTIYKRDFLNSLRLGWLDVKWRQGASDKRFALT